MLSVYYQTREHIFSYRLPPVVSEIQMTLSHSKWESKVVTFHSHHTALVDIPTAASHKGNLALSFLLQYNYHRLSLFLLHFTNCKNDLFCNLTTFLGSLRVREHFNNCQAPLEICRLLHFSQQQQRLSLCFLSMRDTVRACLAWKSE